MNRKERRNNSLYVLSLRGAFSYLRLLLWGIVIFMLFLYASLSRATDGHIQLKLMNVGSTILAWNVVDTFNNSSLASGTLQPGANSGGYNNLDVDASPLVNFSTPHTIQLQWIAFPTGTNTVQSQGVGILENASFLGIPDTTNQLPLFISAVGQGCNYSVPLKNLSPNTQTFIVQYIQNGFGQTAYINVFPNVPTTFSWLDSLCSGGNANVYLAPSYLPNPPPPAQGPPGEFPPPPTGIGGLPPATGGPTSGPVNPEPPPVIYNPTNGPVQNTNAPPSPTNGPIAYPSPPSNGDGSNTLTGLNAIYTAVNKDDSDVVAAIRQLDVDVTNDADRNRFDITNALTNLALNTNSLYGDGSKYAGDAASNTALIGSTLQGIGDGFGGMGTNVSGSAGAFTLSLPSIGPLIGHTSFDINPLSNSTMFPQVSTVAGWVFNLSRWALFLWFVYWLNGEVNTVARQAAELPQGHSSEALPIVGEVTAAVATTIVLAALTVLVIALVSYVTSGLVSGALAHPFNTGGTIVQNGIYLLNSVFDISTCLALITQRLTIPWYLTKAYYVCAGVVRYAVGLIIITSLLAFSFNANAQFGGAPVLDSDGNVALMPFVVQNSWTNDVILIFQDQNGNWPINKILQGATFHGITPTAQMYSWDASLYAYLVRSGEINSDNGGQTDFSDGLGCDGSTNGSFFILTYYPLDQGIQDENGTELYNTGANLVQGPDVLYQLNYSQIKETPPPNMYGVADFLEYWFYGVCVAWVLYLTGSMRRLLGRVHEVNTDL